MKTSKAELTVGIFALVVLGILTFMTFRVGEFTWGKKRGYTAYVFFNNTAGLDEKTKIKIAGVDAGTVEKIELINGQARITLRLFPEVNLYSDAGASIKATGLLGDKYLELRPGSQPPLITDGGTIQNVTEFADIGELVRNLSQISGKLMEFLADISDEEIKESLRTTIKNLRFITDDMKYLLTENKQKVNEIVSRVNSIAKNVDEFVKLNREPLTRTVSNVETFTNTLREDGPRLVENLNKVAQDLKDLLEKTGPEITNITQKAGTAMESINDISGRISRGEGTLGKLVKDDKLYESLSSAAQGIDKTLSSIERFRTFVTFRNDYLTKVDESKGAFYLTLQPRDDKYYILGIIKDPVGSVEVTETTTNGFFEREEKIEDKIEFTAQFAKRYRDTALRIGLTESTFGLGADQFLFDDKLIISADAWDFNGDEELSDKAHLRVGADYFLFKNLFISAGYDNILNSNRKGAYFGGGLRFEDEDLKYLLGSAPKLNVN